jgi:OPA family glycerol-3-phosphate transporter-like MFS transporter
VYLHEHAGYSVSGAASLSAVFPGVGVASVLLCGWLSDRIGENGRATIMFFGFAASAAALLMLMYLPPGEAGAALAVGTIGLVAFCLLGPYSYLGGAYALDFGGKQGGAVSSGIIDGIGYLGGVLAGDTVARVAVTFGWKGVFLALGAVCMLAAAGAGYLYVWNANSRRAADAPAS